MTLDQHYQRYLTHPDHLDALFQAIHRRAINAARSFHHPDPEEFAQRVCERIYRRWPLMVRKSFSGLVNTSIRRLLTNDARKRKTQVQIVSDEDADTQHTGDTIYTPSRDAYRDVTQIGKPALRKLAEMLIVGHSKQECADALGVSVRSIERMVAA